jgi:hypothetical protein
MSNPHTARTTGSAKKRLADLTPRERKLIEHLEKDIGHELSQQEINLALDQARHMGHL